MVVIILNSNFSITRTQRGQIYFNELYKTTYYFPKEKTMKILLTLKKFKWFQIKLKWFYRGNRSSLCWKQNDIIFSI